ncbi:hypothetical protein JCM4814A_06500 [Streptomyces phaeofaciens JCM 4814]|uniref:Uncharacterized protein n=1 Tax=Streptomyces phaeofaciens TaxID=68254 RepID=A0A918LV55_9ACTN|nr:hypothetical protein GCM10010226_34010 [Streptomyces phaeofaciens]
MLAVTGEDGRLRAHGERGAHLRGLLPLAGQPEVQGALLLELTGLFVDASRHEHVTQQRPPCVVVWIYCLLGF